MLQKFLYFLKYHNAVPLAVSFALLSSVGGVLAANPAMREQVAASVVSVDEEVLSIDNQYIIDKNLKMYVPKIKILGVVEDDEYYYVQYEMTTIDVVDFVWQDVTKQKEMMVSKQALNGRDLGLYVTRQLKEVFDQELAYLGRVQKIEKEFGPQQKVSVKKYKGLVGKFFDPEQSVFPGYKPVIAEKAPPNTKRNDPPLQRPQRELINPEDQRTVVPQETEPVTEPEPDTASEVLEGEAEQAAAPEVPDSEDTQAATSTPSNSNTEGGGEAPTTSPSVDTEAPTIQLLGDNPTRVLAGASYVDLGVVVTDNVNEIVEYTTHGLDAIDFSVPGTYEIFYLAVDGSANTAEAQRTINVYEEESADDAQNESAPLVEEQIPTPTEEPPVSVPEDEVVPEPIEEQPSEEVSTPEVSPEPISS